MQLLLLSALAILIGGGFALYNGYISLRTRAENAWSDIDTQLKKRFDLLPGLLATAKGYMQHEASTLEKVTQLRSENLPTSPHERENIEKDISDSLNTFFILVEDYPDLKAAPQFIKLQNSLVQIEEDISHARRYYNAVVRDYNSFIFSMPALLLTRILGWKDKSFFALDEAERSTTNLSL